MVIANSIFTRVLLVLIKDFSKTHTITSLAKDLKLSRVGMWKILKKLESKQFIRLNSVGSGKTSTSMIDINWDNILVEKSLDLYLTEESLQQRRWRLNFADMENIVDFLILHGSILYSSNQARDIDIIGVVSQKKSFIKIQKIIDTVQKTQSKKIHSINFTQIEFIDELRKPNKALIDSIKKGVILFGQENFVKLMKGRSK